MKQTKRASTNLVRSAMSMVTWRNRGIQAVAFAVIFATIGATVLLRIYASGGVSVFSSTAVPAMVDSGDGQAVELGAKFQTDVAGSVTGVRFYKSSLNTGTHIGNLWTSSGVRLASATFTTESQSGWQQVSFDKPVAVSPNVTYVVSYHTSSGHYSDDINGTARQITSSPLRVLADGASGPNGVYAYGSASSFPTSGWESSNYWVDVVFDPAKASPTPTVTSTTASPTATPTPTAAATPAPVTGLRVDKQVSAHVASGSSVSAPALSTTSGNDLLEAFIMVDGPDRGQGVTVKSVSGGGLTWKLRQRSNAQAGDSEIWQAVAPTALANVVVKASLSGAYASSMVVTAFAGANTMMDGAVVAAQGSQGAPTVTLTTTQSGSWVWGDGNDYDRAIARMPGSGQTLVDQYLAPVGDTYWVQRQTAPTPGKGTSVTLSDTASTADRWNMAAVEILPATMTSGGTTPTPTPTPAPSTSPTPQPDVTPPTAPANLTATAASSSQINLMWSASADNVGVTGYNVFRDGVKVAGVAAGATSYSDAGLAPATAYSYYVRAVDAAGNAGAASAMVTASTKASADTSAPTTPAGLTATASGPTKVALAWSASADNVGVASYLILRNGAVIGTATITQYSDTTVVANATYSYTVEARDAAGNVSAASAAAQVTTPNPPDTTAPGVPTGLAATAVSGTQVNLSWNASTDNVGVAGYYVYRGGVKIGATVAPSFGDGTTTAGVGYSYSVSAFDGAGNVSAQTAAVSVTTPGGATATPTPTPTPLPGGGSPLTSRPNDGTGYWPDFSNTGYSRTPANAGGLGLGAYPGHLTDYQSGMSADKYMGITFPDNSVIAYKHFVGKVGIFGNNLTFVGCMFEGTEPNDNLVQVYSTDKVKFLYTTFKPVSYVTPPGNDGTVSSSHTHPGTPFAQSWQLVTVMTEAVATMDHDDIWGNAGLEMVTGHTGQPSTWTNNYIHDMSDTANNVYHHDGIGPQSEGNGGPMYIDHNTIASLGNTNGLALQGSGVYDHITFTNNYVSGWGYALSIGVTNNATNITVTNNVFSAELSQLYGFLYGGFWGGTARGSTWRGNLLQVRTGDGNGSVTPADNGKYYWPTTSDGHDTDYSG